MQLRVKVTIKCILSIAEFTIYRQHPEVIHFSVGLVLMLEYVTSKHPEKVAGGIIRGGKDLTRHKKK